MTDLQSQMEKQMDDTVERFNGTILSRKFLRHKNVDVEEIIGIHKDAEKGNQKIMWVRESLETTRAYGVPNPIIHADFLPEHGVTLEAARRRVREKFDEYWQL